MKKLYAIVEPADGSGKYKTRVNSRYALEGVCNSINSLKPDSFVMIGDELAIMAGNIKAMYIIEEEVETDDV